MPGITSTTTLRALFTRLYATFDGVATGNAASDLMALATRIPVTTNIATFGWLGAFPKFREWLGQRHVHGLSQRSYQVYTKDYELTVGVDRNQLDDNTFVEKDMIVRAMAAEAVNLPRDLLIDLLVNGHQRVTYDGQYFFDTDHGTDPTVAGSQSNYEAAGFALTRANFITARARMRQYKAENGRVFGGAQGRLKLVVPTALEQTAIDIFGVQMVASGSAATNNTLYNAVDIIVVPELDAYSTTAWYLFEVSDRLPPPFILLERQAPRFQVKDGPADENVFWNKEYIFGADARYGAGYGFWPKAFKGVG